MMKTDVKNILEFILKKLKGNTTLILAIVSVILFALLVNQCKETNRLKDQATNTSDFLNSEISYYKNELNQEVAQKDALKGDKESLEILLSKQIDSTKQLTRLVDSFKKVKSAGNIIQETKIDTVLIPFEKTIDFKFVRQWSNAIPVQTGNLVFSLGP